MGALLHKSIMLDKYHLRATCITVVCRYKTVNNCSYLMDKNEDLFTAKIFF
jgi:hypothetical protein